MTPFIQLWEGSRRIPNTVAKLIPEYANQDVIFIPENTKQRFSVTGEVQSEIPIQINPIVGFNYTVSSGTLIVGTNLRVNLN